MDQAARPAGARPRRHASSAWREAHLDARALSSSMDPLRLLDGMVVIADALVVAAASTAAFLLRYGPGAPPVEIGAATALALLLVLNFRRPERIRAAMLSGSFLRQFGEAARTWLLSVVGVLVAAYLTHTSAEYARLWGGLWVTLSLAGFATIRAGSTWSLRRWRLAGRLARILAIVDLDGHGPVLARRLLGDMPGQVLLIGIFRPARAGGGEAGTSATVDQLFMLSRQFRIDEVLVTASADASAEVQNVVRRLSTIPTTVRLCPSMPALGTTPLRTAELLLDAPTLVVCRSPLSGWHVVLKRLEDVAIGSLALLALGPVMLLVALAIRLGSPGPVLFKQARLGFNNNPITVYKFRTMYHVRRDDDAVVVQARRQDPRVTPLGRLLRRSSLDELPQLLNVLRGEMSLVGPRPHALAHNTHYAALIDGYLGRHRVQPGITGWAQVNGLRGETDTIDKMQRRVEFDLAYIDRWSILLDLRIIAQTAAGVLFQRAAY